MSYTKLYSVSDGEIVSIYKALFDAVYVYDEDAIEKSDTLSGNIFDLVVTTIDTLGTNTTYHFSLNEIEAKFDVLTDELTSITLRDTSVNKKIDFTGDKGRLTNARGQDVVGQNSEIKNTTTKSLIYDVTINGNKYASPFEINKIYLELTGIDLDNETPATPEELEIASWWTDFMNIS